jgi:phytol kinase
MIVFVGSEVSYRKFKVSFLSSRKTAHIAGSVVSFFLPYFISNVDAVSIGILFTLAIFISKKNYIFKGIHDKDGLGIGEVVFPLGIAISALIVWPLSIIAYQGSCLVLGFSDGLAGYIGNIYGKKSYRVFGGNKTIEGSAIFFLFTIAIFISYYILYGSNNSILGLILLSIYAAGVTFVEAILSCGWDNLIIPITAGLALILVIS